MIGRLGIPETKFLDTHDIRQNINISKIVYKFKKSKVKICHLILMALLKPEFWKPDLSLYYISTYNRFYIQVNSKKKEKCNEEKKIISKAIMHSIAQLQVFQPMISNWNSLLICSIFIIFYAKKKNNSEPTSWQEILIAAMRKKLRQF